MVKTFKYKLDFYWQSLLIYSVILIAYSLLRGNINLKDFTFSFHDPLVVLLSLFVIVTFLFGVINFILKRSLTIGNDFIEFSNRFRKKRFEIQNIEKISVTFENRIKTRGRFTIIKLKIHGRKWFLRIRPNIYTDSKELMKSIDRLRQNFTKVTV